MFLIFLLFTFMILALINSRPEISGFSTFATQENVSGLIKGMTLDRSFEFLSNGARICIVVEIDNQTIYYYNMTKFNDSAIINQFYCADPGQDNLILKFNSYDSLLEAKNYPKWFISQKRNIGYYIFPSNYISPGGQVNCTPQFQEKYCGALYAFFRKSSDIAGLALPCCANYRFIPRTPAGLAFAFGASIEENWWIYVAVLLIIMLFLYFFSRKKKKH